MSDDLHPGHAKDDTPHGSLKSYTAGLVLSLLLTLAAYFAVWRHVHSGHQLYSHQLLTPLILGLALVQLIAQLIFFLHLGRESKPRWNLLVLSFAALVVIILVAGSLWIMANLSYHHGHNATPTDTYIIHDEGIHH